MPTPDAGFSVTDSHHARSLAEGFGSDAGRYDRTRPSYPPALVERIVAASPGREILDVGIGTGTSARPFRNAGCRICGVEVDARMAEFARAQGFEVEIARFEEWESAGRRFDLVVAGQAWHWVDPVAGAAKAGELLRPGGRLAVFWNAFEFPAQLAAAFGAVYACVVPDSPFAAGSAGSQRGYAAFFDNAAEGMRQAGVFGEPERWQVDWQRSYSHDEWLDQVPTFGGHNQFSPAQLSALLAGIGAAIDASGGSFTVSYASVAVTAALAGHG